MELESRLLGQTPKPALELQPGWREAAVLVPVLLRAGSPHLIFTQRPAALRNHGGEISFPGGGKDPNDVSPMGTALRETEEELGILPEQVKVLGTLDQSLTTTGYCIVPVVGALTDEVQFRPNSLEVEEVLEIPWSGLRGPQVHRTEQRTFHGRTHEVHVYEYSRYVIWGATARIVWNLFQVAGELTG